jgi:DNA topoisomerase-1
MYVVTEKGSVARSIRTAVTPSPRVLALSGHFLGLDFPKKYNVWREVDPKELFHAPIRWIITNRKNYGKLANELKDAVSPIVMATDNDPEGELIAYEVLHLAKNVLGDFSYKRMRFNVSTRSELQHAWSNLEEELNWGWVWKALFRHKFDLVTGAAYTRLLTLSAQRRGRRSKLVSWGSCQTPTLWFVYERDMEIRNFNPEKYYVIEAKLKVEGITVKLSSPPIKSKEDAETQFEKARTAREAVVKEYALKDEVRYKPWPTDTDAMLQELTKLLPISGAQIMSLAESLYAEGCISYPRTQTNMWIKVEHKTVLATLTDTPLAEYVTMEDFNPRDGRKNDGAHPPIHPTEPCDVKSMKGKIWDYLARRYLANVVSKDALFKRWNLRVDLNGVILQAGGRYLTQEGFYRVFPYFKPRSLQQIPEVHLGMRLVIEDVYLEERETKPPPHLSESNLLSMMERHSIGTDATRQIYPSLIVRRGYAYRRGKSLELSSVGYNLINTLKKADDRLVTPETRAYVEKGMIKVEKRSKTVEEALRASLHIYEKLYEKLANGLSSPS